MQLDGRRLTRVPTVRSCSRPAPSFSRVFGHAMSPEQARHRCESPRGMWLSRKRSDVWHPPLRDRPSPGPERVPLTASSAPRRGHSTERAAPTARRRHATFSPASQPGARPPAGGRIEAVSIPLRASTHAITEFEFHISPVCSSSRPQTGVGTCGTASSTRRAQPSSLLSRCGLSTASATSGIRPPRQTRIS